jgi:pectinesterase
VASAIPAAGRAVTDGGLYEMQNRYSGKCVDIPDGSTQQTVQVQQYTCNDHTYGQWWWTNLDSNGYYQLRNPNSNMCLMDTWGWTTNGVPAEQYFCEGGTFEEWVLYPVPNLNNTYYVISNANPVRCLGTSPNFDVSNNDLLEIVNCDWGADQQWIFDTPNTN